jgi:alpha-glucosidase (family GH31 glycosyl hydrolase)
LLESCGKAPVTFSRAGFTGSAVHGCFWAGDEDSTWDAFRGSLTAGLNASASGIVYWGWDIGGFSGPLPTPELYLRSTAVACFAPIMQYHSEFNHHRKPARDRTPWNVAEQSGDASVIEVFRRFAQLRERLVPYLSQQASSGIERGLPLMRPLPFAFPDDDNTWRYPYEYLLGDELLVCPVTEEGAVEWDCYLPAGEWVDVWTGEPAGGSTVMPREVPITAIPVWCRAAAWEELGPIFSSLSR